MSERNHTKGYVRLYRSACDNPDLSSNLMALGLFSYLLLKAAHKPTRVKFRGREYDLKPGELVTSFRMLAVETDVNYRTLHRVTVLLKSCHIVSTKPVTKGTIVSICNWDKYQASEDKPVTTEMESVSQPDQKRVTQNVTTHKNKKILDSESYTDSESNSENQSLIPTIDQNQFWPIEIKQDIDERFEEWWACWVISGTKRGKAKAQKTYQRIVRKKQATPSELIDGLKQYMVWCHRMATKPDFIKHPTTWLNAGAWSDELSTETTDRGKSGYGKFDSKELATELDQRLERRRRRRNGRIDGGADSPVGFVEGTGQPSRRPERS